MMRTSTRTRLRVTERSELRSWITTQQPGLRLRRDGADPVEEDRTAIGDFEEPFLGGDRARKGALGVAKELRFEQPGRDIAAVDRDKLADLGPRTRKAGSPARPPPCRVPDSPVTSISRSCRRDLLDQVVDLAHRCRGADDLRPVGRLTQERPPQHPPLLIAPPAGDASGDRPRGSGSFSKGFRMQLKALSCQAGDRCSSKVRERR
jgi:hypothetical protein